MCLESNQERKESKFGYYYAFVYLYGGYLSLRSNRPCVMYTLAAPAANTDSIESSVNGIVHKLATLWLDVSMRALRRSSSGSPRGLDDPDDSLRGG